MKSGFVLREYLNLYWATVRAGTIFIKLIVLQLPHRHQIQ